MRKTQQRVTLTIQKGRDLEPCFKISLVTIFQLGSSWLLSAVVAAALQLKSDPVWQLLVVTVVSLKQVLLLKTHFPSLFCPSKTSLHHFHSTVIWSASLNHPQLQIFPLSVQIAPWPLFTFSLQFVCPPQSSLGLTQNLWILLPIFLTLLFHPLKFQVRSDYLLQCH